MSLRPVIERLNEANKRTEMVHVPVETWLYSDLKFTILLWWFLLFYVLVFKFFVLLVPYVCYHTFGKVWVTEWPPIGKIAAHSA